MEQATKNTASRSKNLKLSLISLGAAYTTVAAELMFLAYAAGSNIRYLRPQIESLTALPKASGNECFYVSKTRERKISFQEYPTGVVSGTFRLVTPFMDSQRRTYALGSAPVINVLQAPCSILTKDGGALSPKQAQSLLADWQRAFLSSPEMLDALKEARSGEGFLRVTTSDKEPLPWRYVRGTSP